MNNNKMNNNKTLILSMIVAILIIGLVAGGTYAFWTWRSANNTAVAFTVTGSLPAPTVVQSGTLTLANAEPIATCNGVTCIKAKATFTYANPTPYPATLAVDLNLTGFTLKRKVGTDTELDDELSHLHWRFTTTTANATAATANATVFTPVSAFVTGTDTSFKSLTFASGSTADVTAAGLPKKLGTVSLKVPAGTASTSVDYYIYLWLDSGYTHQNIGTTITDPLQGLRLSVTLGPTGTYIQSAS